MQITCDAAQSFAAGPIGDFCPVLPWDARPFGQGGVSPYSRSLSRVEKSNRIQERNERQIHNIYLAGSNPVASAHS
jgi:hypothetical protein